MRWTKMIIVAVAVGLALIVLIIVLGALRSRPPLATAGPQARECRKAPAPADHVRAALRGETC